MEHVYAALLLNESGAELNERNLTGVLEAAGCAGGESRTKALVAALEGVDVDGVGPDAAREPDDGGDGRAATESDSGPATDGSEESTDAAPATEE